MKLKNCLILSKFNIKGSKRKNTVLIMMSLTVVAVTVLAGFLNVVNDIVLKSENRLSMRQILLFPTQIWAEDYISKGITADNINEVLDINHVLSCKPEPYLHQEQFVDYLKITDKNENDVTNSKEIFNTEWLSENLYIQQVDADFSARSFMGEQLKDSPAMSCIIPDRLSIWDAETEKSSIIEIPYEELIGKTLTVNCNYLIHNFEEVKDGAYTGDYEYIGEITYNLKVIGAFHYDHASSLVSLQISDETARKIEAMAIEQAVEENPKVLEEYRNDPYARDHIVTVDKYENVAEVEEKLNDLGFSGGAMNELPPSEEMFNNIFTGAGTFLLVAILVLTVIILFLSVYSNINERKSEIGLMKAVGYNSGQIFKSMYLENMLLALKAFLIGGVISAILIAVINLLNTNSGNIVLFSYVMPWSSFFILALVALALILIIPLICLLIMTVLIAKIPPQEAMNS